MNNKKIKLQIWDVGGEERFRFLLPTYFKQAEGGIFMYDTTNYTSLANIDGWLKIIRKKIDYSFPIIVVGNKTDLSKKRQVSLQEGIEIAKSRDMDAHIECSAKTGENIEEIFEALTKLMLQRFEQKLGPKHLQKII